MIPFTYTRADGVDAAVRAGSEHGAKFLGGGTNLVDLMKDGVELPSALVDVNHLGMDTVAEVSDGVRIGASISNSDLANHALIVERYPLLSFALLAGASPQLRNMATTGGNLLQRTRCPYFTDTAFPSCNKRKPGSGCGAVDGYNRNNAVIGQTDDGPHSSKTCIATNPSDMNVAMAALDAQVELVGPKGKRTVPVREFHRLVGDDPTRDTVIRPDELITAVLLPKASARYGGHVWYVKARDRQSYAFALVSVGMALELDGDTIRSGAFALGGVAHKPWRSDAADRSLSGKPANEATFRAAAEMLLRSAHGYADNAFKIELAKDCVARAGAEAARGLRA